MKCAVFVLTEVLLSKSLNISTWVCSFRDLETQKKENEGKTEVDDAINKKKKMRLELRDESEKPQARESFDRNFGLMKLNLPLQETSSLLDTIFRRFGYL